MLVSSGMLVTSIPTHKVVQPVKGKVHSKHGLPKGELQCLVRSEKTGHGAEPVKFTKNMFDTYATSLPLPWYMPYSIHTRWKD